MKVHKDSMHSSDRAHSLGWDTSRIKVLDGDLGKSGQTTAGREDFHQLMAAVGLGEVGAVFALEASRFSRSQADWHKLLDSFTNRRLPIPFDSNHICCDLHL